MKNKELREIEELNNPKPMVFIGDVIVQVLISTVISVAMLFLGWLGIFCTYHFMVFLGLY